MQKRLGSGVKVDWSDVRVICIAPNYKKYDLHAVQVMGANIELWKYRLFSNDSIYLEEVFHASKSAVTSAAATTIDNGYKNPVMVEAGKKAALIRATATYTFNERLEGKSEEIRELTATVREFILGMDESIEEVPKSFMLLIKSPKTSPVWKSKARTLNFFSS